MYPEHLKPQVWAEPKRKGLTSQIGRIRCRVEGLSGRLLGSNRVDLDKDMPRHFGFVTCSSSTSFGK